MRVCVCLFVIVGVFFANVRVQIESQDSLICISLIIKAIEHFSNIHEQF